MRDSHGQPVRQVRAGGIEFGYLESGAGPLVLLLHGFPETAHTWDQLRPRIAEMGFRVVAPFMRGYYPTEIPKREDYGSDTLGKDVLELCGALSREPAIVLGHDFGASAAFAAVGLNPRRIRFLITGAMPHPRALSPTPKMIWAARHFWTLSRSNATERVAQGDFAYVDELLRRWSPGWEPPPGEADAVKAAFREAGCLNAALGYYRAISPWLSRGHRASVSVPSVALAGVTDLLEPKLFHRAERYYTAGYRVVYVPGGHFAHREFPEAYADAVCEVLRPLRPELSPGERVPQG